MTNLVLVRHGQSEWNKKNIFTGWVDVPLSEQGIQEAKEAGSLIKKHGLEFDLAYTSLLQRAEQTLDVILGELGANKPPVKKSWRLNERHYGALQGKNKKEMAQQHGEEQVQQWRRSYSTRPPLLENPQDQPMPWADEQTPRLAGESLEDTYLRVVPFWENAILPSLLQEHKRILIVAHGNSLRALLKHLYGIADEDIPGYEIPTGKPLSCPISPDGAASSFTYIE